MAVEPIKPRPSQITYADEDDRYRARSPQESAWDGDVMAEDDLAEKARRIARSSAGRSDVAAVLRDLLDAIFDADIAGCRLDDGASEEQLERKAEAERLLILVTGEHYYSNSHRLDW